MLLKKVINKTSKVFIFTLLISQSVFAETISVQFAYVGPETHSALLGAQQGLDEANLQGQFLNQKYSLDTLSPDVMDKHDFSSYIAVLSALDSEGFTQLTNKLPGTPVFNLSADDNSLRLSCMDNALHVIPSKQMRDDAEAQWIKKDADASAKAQAWHPAFVKFAARDLNKRYKKKHNISMDDMAWAGWAAVKMTSDTVARANITTAAKMLTYLKTELTFDGQKGSNMTFRETGQIRQLMLLIDDNDKIVTEAPIRGIAKPPTLDSLGILECEK